MFTMHDEHGARRVTDERFGSAAAGSTREGVAASADDDEVSGQVNSGANNFSERDPGAHNGEGASGPGSCESFAN